MKVLVLHRATTLILHSDRNDLPIERIDSSWQSLTTGEKQR
jgi:hypothetical protein